MLDMIHNRATIIMLRLCWIESQSCFYHAGILYLRENKLMSIDGLHLCGAPLMGRLRYAIRCVKITGNT